MLGWGGLTLVEFDSICDLMGQEVVNESWFGSFRWTTRKGVAESQKSRIGVLSFEVAALMSKVVSLWHCLSDKEIERLRDEIVSSVGVQKIVSSDVDYLMDLVLNEILENFGMVARSVGRLSRKCAESPFSRFEDFVNDPVENSLEWFCWQYRPKKMDRKVKKMERFVAVTMQLVQELEVLAELERSLRRMKANSDLDKGKFADFRRKVTLQRSEVRCLCELSPRIRTYDYTVRLLARSLITILVRIKIVFDVKQEISPDGQHDAEDVCSEYSFQSQSFSALLQSSVHPAENMFCGFSSRGNLGRSGSTSRLVTDKSKINSKKPKHHRQSSALFGNHVAHVGPFKGCMSGNDSPILNSCKLVVNGYMRFNVDHRKSVDRLDKSIGSFSCSGRVYSKLALLNSKCQLLKAPPSTLGNAALALHYANLVVLIEKFASSPHNVDLEARDDLYNMLPTTIRTALRSRLKAYSKAGALFVYDASLAEEWGEALSDILEWLSPLAHKTIRWESERNFESRQEFSGTTLLLVQTLHYANQAKTEAAIIELLVSLNYICRINTELVEKAAPKFSGCRLTKYCSNMQRSIACAYAAV